MINKKIYFFIIVILVACQTNKKPELTIAAASNMQYAIKALAKKFTSNTGKKCNVILSSSGKLTAQITQGAPYDIFLAANVKYPSTLHKEGYTLNKPKVYGYGNLILWSEQSNITPTIALLNTQNIKKIAIANPLTAPYGQASLKVLSKYQLIDSLKNKLVFGESISQVNQFIRSKSVEIGFTSKSILNTQKVTGNWLEIPARLYPPIAQGIVILKQTKHLETATAFYRFVFSKDGQKILKKFGYTSVNQHQKNIIN